MSCARSLCKLTLIARISLYALAFLLSGCSLNEISKQAHISDNLGQLTGRVIVKSGQKGKVIVLRFLDVDGVAMFESQTETTRGGDFLFMPAPGPQYIAAFVDANNDKEYQSGEHGVYYGSPSTIEVVAGQSVSVGTLTITGVMPASDTKVSQLGKSVAAWKNIGSVTGLDDPRFTRTNYEMGLWKPLKFLEVAEGGLFFLQDYQADKVPVLFIHGVKGGPTDWQSVIEDLDKDRFQPWVLFYPSGFRLDVISTYLAEAVSRMQDKYGFKQLNVVAHSMGGLVARSFVKKYVDRSPENSKRLRMVMTINSPMMGMTAAASGVKHSPIVIPSWRDVEPGSQFLDDLHGWDWPAEIPYHLVFSYESGESGDGVVPLQSQIPMKLQAEALRIYGFNEDHVGTLNDGEFHILFNKIMAQSF